MSLLAWRIGGKIGIALIAYQPGAKNTKPALRELAGFDLTGEIESPIAPVPDTP